MTWMVTCSHLPLLTSHPKCGRIRSRADSKEFFNHQEHAMTKIADKYMKLRRQGFDMGSLIGEEEDAGFGGLLQRYERGQIYWHPVMKSEAHEVHGGILDTYLSLLGPGNPVTGERYFGFPISDEVLTLDGLYAVSYFEFGAI